VCEDEAAVRKLAVRLLRDAGYTVLAAEGGQDALRLAEERGEAIDLLLTDVIMPDMNGRDLYERITKLREGVRVLFTSGYTDDVIARHGILERGFHFLQKPFDTASLLREVRDALESPALV